MSDDDNEYIDELTQISESRDRATALSDAVFEAVFISEKGVCIETNGAASEMFGYRYDEIVGFSVTDVIVEEDRGFVQKNMLSEHEDAYEAICLRKDGSTFVGEMRGRMFDYMGRPCRVSVVRDMTLYKESQDKLAASEDRYDFAIRGTTDGIWDWDRETDQVYFSPRWKEIIGYEDHEFSNDIDEWKKRIHPDDIDRVLEVNDLFFKDATAKHFSVEYQLRHKNGKYVWILGRGTCHRDENGSPYRMAGAHTDITESKRNMDALERSEQKLRNILINTPQIGVSFDPEGTVVFVNDHFCTVTGWEKEEAIGHKWINKFVPEDKRILFQNDFQTLIASKGTPEYASYEDDLICKNGEQRHIAWSSVVSRDVDGLAVDVTCLGVDLTDSERAKAALQCAKEYAESANEAKSVFLATMSHEIRTPLNGIMGMLQLAKLTVLDSEGEEYISTALSSSRDLLRILSDVLDISRIEAGLLEISETEFTSNLMVDPVVNSFEEMARNKGLTLRHETHPAVPAMLRGDIGRIRQILVNLISNSIKYTGVGTIDVVLDAEDNSAQGYCNVIFQVRDTGHGIPKDQLDTIWEPFSQLDATSYSVEFGGIGLGLSIVRRLVESMGGRVDIDSVLGAGTTVTVKLPLAIVDVETIVCKIESDVGKLAEQRSKKVLLVEDDSLNQLALKNMLLKVGVDVTLACNGKEAVKKALSEQFSLIFMDVQMPVMNGIEATKNIIAQADPCTRPPIVAMTAYAMRGDRERFLSSGMDDYMAKPVEFDDLVAMVAKHLGVQGEE